MMKARQHPHVITLGQLLTGWVLPPAELVSLPVSGLAIDSRRLQPGEVFLAYAGDRVDGRDFVAEAEARGAAAIVAEPGRRLAVTIPLVELPDLRRRVGVLASRMFGEPSLAMPVIGVTGTNGKTTCVRLISQLLTALGQPCGSIGTLGIDPGGIDPAGIDRGSIEPGSGAISGPATGSLTTPDPITLQAQLAIWREQGLAAAMEVSSHALEQNRVGGMHFRVAAFTNLSRDHLDYHASMDAYFDAKSRLFADCHPERVVLNADEPVSAELARRCPPSTEVLFYSAQGAAGADVRCLSVDYGADGAELRVASPWGEWRLRSPLLGEFNVANLLAALTVVAMLQRVVDRAALARAVAALQPVPGRLQILAAPNGGGANAPRVVVDYAHTPDALGQALTALRRHCGGRLWCVFGAGGDRDAGKRPLMGAAAALMADVIIITSDNPRSEAPQQIAADILAGFETVGVTPEREIVSIELDRAAAIHRAIATAAPEDWILIAGKGHEQYQEIAGRRQPFSDVDVAQAALAGRAAS